MTKNINFVATLQCKTRSNYLLEGDHQLIEDSYIDDIDFSSRDDILVNRLDNYLIRDFKTPNTSGEHLPILACAPRLSIILNNASYDRGDDSVYNRFLRILKTIMTVLCGVLNSPIAKTLKGISLLVFLFLGDPFSWSISRFKLAFDTKRILGIFVSIVVTQVIHIASSIFSSSCSLQGEGADA